MPIAQIIEPIMINAQISHRRWGILNDSMMINGANPEINNNKRANPSSEMGNKSIPMLETAEMQVSLELSKSEVMCECRGGRYGGR